MLNRHSGVGVFTKDDAATQARIAMFAYSDAAGKGSVTLYKVVLANCETLDISNY